MSAKIFHSRMVLAVALAALGTGLAWWSLSKSMSRGASPQPTEAAVAPAVEAALSAVEFDTHPTKDTVLDAVSRAASRARELYASHSGPGGEKHAEDLQKAFSDRLIATLAGDFDQDNERIRARGGQSSNEATDVVRTRWLRQAAETSLAPISVARLEVRSMPPAGITEEPPLPTFARLAFTPGTDRFPSRSDLERLGAEVVEVRLPMEKTTLHGERRAVLVGYQFAWSVSRGQWVPWGITLYCRPGEVHTAIIF